MKITIGDFVLINPSDYYVGGVTWGKVTGIAPGSASVYPLKVAFPNGLGGQYKFEEILDLRQGKFNQSKDLANVSFVRSEREKGPYWFARMNLDGVPVYSAHCKSREDLASEVGLLLGFYNLL